MKIVRCYAPADIAHIMEKHAFEDQLHAAQGRLAKGDIGIMMGNVTVDSNHNPLVYMKKKVGSWGPQPEW